MKICQFLAFLLLINFIICRDSYCKDDAPTSPTKTDDCSNKKDNGGYCCFAKAIAGTYCAQVSPNQYKAIPEYVKFLKKCDSTGSGNDCVENKEYSIDCKSSYLAFGILSLILIFF